MDMESVVVKIFTDIWVSVKDLDLFTKIVVGFFIVFLTVSLSDKRIRGAFVSLITGIFKRRVPMVKIDIFKNEFLIMLPVLRDRLRALRFDEGVKGALFALVANTLLDVAEGKATDLLEEYEKTMQKEYLVSRLESTIITIDVEFKSELLEKLKKVYGEERGVELYDCVMWGDCGGRKNKDYFDIYIKRWMSFAKEGVLSYRVTQMDDAVYLLYDFFRLLYLAMSLIINNLYATFNGYNGDLKKILQ